MINRNLALISLWQRQKAVGSANAHAAVARNKHTCGMHRTGVGHVDNLNLRADT